MFVIEGTGFSVTDVDEAGSGAVATVNVGEEIITVVAGGSSVTITGGNGTGTVTLSGTIAQVDNLLSGAGTGTITYLNNSNTSQNPNTTARIIEIVASDGVNTGNTAAATVSITAINDPPVAAGNSYAVDNNQSLVVAAPGVLANDTDVDGEPMTGVLVSGPAGGTLQFNSDGSFT